MIVGTLQASPIVAHKDRKEVILPVIREMHWTLKKPGLGTLEVEAAQLHAVGTSYGAVQTGAPDTLQAKACTLSGVYAEGYRFQISCDRLIIETEDSVLLYRAQGELNGRRIQAKSARLLFASRTLVILEDGEEVGLGGFKNLSNGPIPLRE